MRVPGAVAPAHGARARLREAGPRAARRPVPARARATDLDAVAKAYRALDVCLVTSRDEGGPKAVLEAMATGVPLVTTRVGQAADLVRHARNGYIVDVEDAERHRRLGGLCRGGSGRDAGAAGRRPDGRRRRSCSYDALAPRWRELLTGFVALGES